MDSGFSPEDADSVSGSASKLSADIAKAWELSVSDQEIAQIATQLYNDDKDRYRFYPDPDALTTKWFGWNDQLDIVQMELDIMNVLRNKYLGNNTGGGVSQTANIATQLGVTPTQLNQILTRMRQDPDYADMTDEEIIVEIHKLLRNQQ